MELGIGVLLIAIEEQIHIANEIINKFHYIIAELPLIDAIEHI